MDAFSDEWTKLNEVIAYILALLGIVGGGIIAAYYHRKAQKSGKLAMHTNQLQVIDKTKIGQTSLRIKDKSGEEINDDVYVANVTIWNVGNAEIKKEDVRTPYRISMAQNKNGSHQDTIAENPRILELTPIFFTKDNQKFKIDENTGEISWEHFDAHQGFRVKIIYAANSTQKPYLYGEAVGIGELVDCNKHEDGEEISLPRGFPAALRLYFTLLVAGALVIAIIMFLAGYWDFSLKAALVIILLLISLMLALIFVVIRRRLVPSSPPF
jgi:hypothetical protein